MLKFYVGFLSHRGTPSHHPFLDGDFPVEINPPAIGVPPWLWKPPYLSGWTTSIFGWPKPLVATEMSPGRFVHCCGWATATCHQQLDAASCVPGETVIETRLFGTLAIKGSLVENLGYMEVDWAGKVSLTRGSSIATFDYRRAYCLDLSGHLSKSSINRQFSVAMSITSG